MLFDRKKLYSHTKIILFCVFIIYSFLILKSISFHELWRDELQAWGIATSSLSIKDLFSNIRYEGHPVLWFILLFVLSRFSSSVITLQIFSALISLLTISIFLFKSNLNIETKIMFVFSYFMLFEYSVKSRPYMLGVFFIFLFIYLHKNLRKSFFSSLYKIAALFLLAQTTFFGFLLAFWLGVYYILNELTWFNIKKLLIYCISISLSILYIIPNSNYVSSKTPISVERFFQQLNTMNFGLFNNVLISMIIFGICLYIFESRKSKLIYFLATFSFILFFSIIYPGYVWHQGYLFILFISFIWLEKSNNKAVESCSKIKNILLNFVIMIYVFFGVFSYIEDYYRPFSNAKAVASYINQNDLNKFPIIGNPDYLITPVAVYMNRNVYYPKSNRLSTYTVWDSTSGYLDKYSFESLIKSKLDTKDSYLVITTEELSELPNTVLIKSFQDKSIKVDERYYLYRLN